LTRSLVILDRLPYPPIGGQQLRYRQAIEALRTLGPVTLLSLEAGAREAGPPPGCPPLVRLDPKPPHTFLYRWAKLLGPHGKKRLRARLTATWLRDLHRRVDAVIVAAAPDLVVVENPELVAFLPPLGTLGRPVVYDAHNVEKFLWRDLVALRHGLGDRPPREAFKGRILAGEAAVVAAADQVWVCSEEDARLLREAYPGSDAAVRVVPNAVDTAAFADIAAARGTAGTTSPTPRLLFTGNFGYAPNLEAGLALVRDLLPAVRVHRPEIGLVLCGRAPPESLAAAAGRAGGVEITGAVPDVRPWLAGAELFVVPLRHGGGTRLKILEALAAGLPVVSTLKGAEGLSLQDGCHFRLADTLEEMVAAVLWCLENRHAALEMARRGCQRVQELYSWDANAARVRDAVLVLPAATGGPAAPAPARPASCFAHGDAGDRARPAGG
jgi:glycosyltransferase involved in cell wall biosynthesis